MEDKDVIVMYNNNVEHVCNFGPGPKLAHFDIYAYKKTSCEDILLCGTKSIDSNNNNITYYYIERFSL